MGGSLHQARGHHLRWHHLKGEAPWELARECSWAGLVRLRWPGVCHVLQLRAVVGVPPYGDPRRIFGQGTPTEVWRLMIETWAVIGAPFIARITEDISGWERVCDKTIEAKGTIVLDENFRTGRRARKMHGEGDRKTKLRKRDRKSTHLLEPPCAPRAEGGLRDPHGGSGSRGGSGGREIRFGQNFDYMPWAVKK